MNLFEVTAKIMVEQENETLKMQKRVILVEGETFTEMEAVATEWLSGQTQYGENTIIEGIKRVKYSGISFNETLAFEHDLMFELTEYTPEEEDGRFWELQVAFMEESDNGKEKVTKEKFIMPALSQKEAITRLEEEMAECTLDWKVVTGKETPVYACLVSNDTFKIACRNKGIDFETGEVEE